VCAGIKEEDDTRAKGGRRVLELEECARAPKERTAVQRRRDHATIVGRELKHFRRKRINTDGDIFILLKDINSGSQLEVQLINY
jgi:hypothetical protein